MGLCPVLISVPLLARLIDKAGGKPPVNMLEFYIRSEYGDQGLRAECARTTEPEGPPQLEPNRRAASAGAIRHGPS